MPPVALIRPLYEGDESEFQEPLGIERLAGFLEENGLDEVKIFDRRLHEKEHRVWADSENSTTFWEEFQSAFSEAVPPDVIGLSVMTAEDVPDSLRIINRLKTLYPKALFVVGGLFITTSIESAKRRFPSGVRLISYEGELPLLAIVRAATDMSSTQCIETIKVDAQSGYPVDNSLPDGKHRHPVPDEWAIAFRPNLERYLALGCAISLQSSRGCHGSCSFCATPGLPACYRRWEERGIPLIVDEMSLLAERVQKAGLLPIFNFVDDDFGSLVRIEALDSELRDRSVRAAYALQLRVASLLGQDRLAERLMLLREGGFTRVFLGVESLCQETLRSWNKTYAVEGLPEVFAALRKARISSHIGYILWHDGSTIENARAEAEALWKMGLYCSKVAESRMVIFPGSRMHAQSLTSKSGSQVARWEPMSTESEHFYQRLSQRLRPVYEVWKEGAVLLPWLAAQAQLTGDRCHIDELEAVLSQCDLLSYRGLVHDDIPDGLHIIAAQLMDRIVHIRATVRCAGRFKEMPCSMVRECRNNAVVLTDQER